ncbi:Putative Holliday junction resolvase [Urinicoccus massiliensis]|uniref:Putative pre-16S rRNA nuclease n=1 Tax=Urinicoccus massiliensis TaxID=1723382 RepID=A0A8H2MF34_9FIRM|nr:Holliday junction resolvase RuvX [Urinicoccus massiliensis]KGF09820.1 Holliday junction resolvase [Tissierellia bacterium S5-A11]VFB16475.1 Putative Holliday junction resolvase [Urinicoccus massiliensis]
MMRVLGLDVGDVRIGIAVSDPTALVASAYKTLVRTSKWKDVEEVRSIIEDLKVDRVVVGLPKNMNNSLGPQGKKVQKFVNALKHNYPLDLVYVDERLTTVSAERILIEADVSRKNRKKVVDQVAATYILQQYLDMQKNTED